METPEYDKKILLAIDMEQYDESNLAESVGFTHALCMDLEVHGTCDIKYCWDCTFNNKEDTLKLIKSLKAQ